MVYCT